MLYILTKRTLARYTANVLFVKAHIAHRSHLYFPYRGSFCFSFVIYSALEPQIKQIMPVVFVGFVPHSYYMIRSVAVIITNQIIKRLAYFFFGFVGKIMFDFRNRAVLAYCDWHIIVFLVIPHLSHSAIQLIGAFFSVSTVEERTLVVVSRSHLSQ